MSNNRLVLIRHGQSLWNQKNLFTGWMDVDLSEQGKKEAIQAGLYLQKKGLLFDGVFSSALKRAIHTAKIILEKMNLENIPFTKAWQLNERHYGALQGKNRQDMIKKYGEEQVHKWRRGFREAPPPLNSRQKPLPEELYKSLKTIPQGESLEDTQKRALPFWKNNIMPQLQNGHSVLLVAHGNSLRALIKEIENIPDSKIPLLEIKTGKPLVYKFKSKDSLSKEELDEP